MRLDRISPGLQAVAAPGRLVVAGQSLQTFDHCDRESTTEAVGRGERHQRIRRGSLYCWSGPRGNGTHMGSIPLPTLLPKSICVFNLLCLWFAAHQLVPRLAGESAQQPYQPAKEPSSSCQHLHQLLVSAVEGEGRPAAVTSGRGSAGALHSRKGKC